MNNFPSDIFDTDLLSYGGLLNQPPPPPPPSHPPASSNKRKRAATTITNSSANSQMVIPSTGGKGKQIRMDIAADIQNLEDDINGAFEDLFSNVEASVIPLTSTLSRKINNGLITITSPGSSDATHMVKIEIYDMKDIAGIPASDIWKKSITRAKVFIEKKEHRQMFDTLNSITLDVAKKMKAAKGSESKFSKY